MATTTKNEYTGDGSNQLFPFTFPYIEESDVVVSVDGVVLTIITEYIFSNATTIGINVAPANGAKVVIQRVTNSTDLKATFFPGSAIRARDLNDNFTQNLYVTQESVISAVEATQSAEEAATAAASAQASATQAQADASQAAQDAADAAAGIDGAAQDAADAQAAAAAAQASATAAETKADEADAKADQAALDAAAAAQSAQDAADAVLDGGVASVNGKTGIVVLKTSDLENDSGYITSADAPINNIDLTILPLLP